MKNNQVVKVLGAINDTGKLASDMYDLDNKYYLDSKDEYIPIGQMDYQHTIRAFVKLCKEQDPNEGKVLDINMAESDLYKTIDAQESIIKKLREDLQGGFKQSVDDLDSLDAQEKIIAGLRSQVETLQEQLEEKDQEYMDYTAKIERQRDMYRNMAHMTNEVHRTNGCAYIFCEVPQDDKGREFIKNCKKYLNKESYAIRVKGQHLKKELYGQGRAYHGANMEDSTHMRVYIDKKKGENNEI